MRRLDWDVGTDLENLGERPGKPPPCISRANQPDGEVKRLGIPHPCQLAAYEFPHHSRLAVLDVTDVACELFSPPMLPLEDEAVQ